MILAVLVHAANTGDRDGARLLFQDLVGRFPRLVHLFADHGSTSPLIEWIKALLGWDTEILPKPGNASRQTWVLVNGTPVLKLLPTGGFQVQRHRWNVERTFGWLVRYRRLARDDEGLPARSEALIPIAAIRLCFHRLTPFRSSVTSFRHTLRWVGQLEPLEAQKTPASEANGGDRADGGKRVHIWIRRRPRRFCSTQAGSGMRHSSSARTLQM